VCSEILFTVICSQFRYEPWKRNGGRYSALSKLQGVMCDFSWIPLFGRFFGSIFKFGPCAYNSNFDGQRLASLVLTCSLTGVRYHCLNEYPFENGHHGRAGCLRLLISESMPGESRLQSSIQLLDCPRLIGANWRTWWRSAWISCVTKIIYVIGLEWYCTVSSVSLITPTLMPIQC